MAKTYNVVIVGAGAAGIGAAVALSHADVDDVLIVDRHGVGASFERWPKEMTLLTPSFPTNSIGMLDLNSVAIGTSPAYTLVREHPSGKEYAKYLKAVAKHFKLTMAKNVDVRRVEPTDNGFRLRTSAGIIRTRYVIWAAGEFQYPRTDAFPGAELCLHSAAIESWRRYEPETALVIGGAESGIDAAIQLAALQKKVTLLARTATWERDDSDPSVTLSTYTQERLEAVLKLGGRIECVRGAHVTSVEQTRDGYVIRGKGRKTWRSPTQPILAVGFSGSHALIGDLWEPRDDGYPLLTDDDASTTTPGLYFVGPLVRHEQHIFCFIYKFRQRFAVVAKSIATQLGLAAEDLETYRQWGMYLDDLSCCGTECVC